MEKNILFLLLFTQASLFAQDNSQYGKSFTFNLNSFKSRASQSIQSNGLAGKMTASFSLPDGKFENFVFNETLITPTKSVTFQTYNATSEDGKKIMKLTVIGNKLEGIMHTPEGYFYIETIDAKQNLYRIYRHEELPSDKYKINCGATDQDFKPKKNGRILSVAPFPYGTQLKRFTAAIVVTKEMTNLYTSQDLALAQVVSITNANNLIYELEAAMTFVLATQTTDKTLIFTNANPGPAEFGTINVPNCQAGFTVLHNDSTLLYNTYGIGHTFNTLPAIPNGSSGNGVAGPTPCVDDSKARGFTQWTLGSPLSLIINIFTHELGHQFSAPHTYNAIGGTASNNTFCLDGWSSTSAIEPGSGTTMMSYANNCVNPTNYTINGNNNLQYFGAKSLEFIRNAIASTSGGCATNVALTNTPPVASAGTAITIPKGTPFTLKGTGTDANNDVLTYTWEQYDVATENDKGAFGSTINGQGGYTAVNSTTAPLFRNEQSSTSTSRDFPRISNILNGNTPPDAAGEALPQVARTMKFRFTVRDNKFTTNNSSRKQPNHYLECK
ncbi:MAG: M12 family metallo-peptidase [Spirosomaceae bacterium]|nr:M12 family metallo-peptidase [Spirosomataceae bacterium]